MKDKEEIRQSVRKTYGDVALKAGTVLEKFKSKLCCGPAGQRPETDRASCGCGSGDMDADRIASLIGYAREDLEGVPEGANLGLGCGNPKAFAGLRKGEVVVDLGSGGGIDCFLAAKLVGKAGRVIGVDMTPEMITRARENKGKMAAENVEFRLGEIEHLPVADNTADLIISNCVINLSPEKDNVYREAYRVLKPGGRLAVSDIVALKPLPEEIKADLALISACVGGAASIEETRHMLEAAGFRQIAIIPRSISPELMESYLPGSRAADFVTPAEITARK